MHVFQVFVVVCAILVCKVDLKTVNQKSGMIFHQDYKTPYDYDVSDIASKYKQNYVPVIDGRPIFIPEEFAEESENIHLENKSGLSGSELDVDNTKITKNVINQEVNTALSAFEEDEVFFIDQRKKFKQQPSYNQNSQKHTITKINEPSNKSEKTKLQDSSKLSQPKTNNRKTICKNTTKNKTTKVQKVDHSDKNMKTENLKTVYANKNEQIRGNKNAGVNARQLSSLNVSEVLLSVKEVTLNSQNNSKLNSDKISKNREIIPETMDESEVHQSLQNEVRSMFGPSFRSFVFNPLAPLEAKFQNCKTAKNESGLCRYVQHCFIPSIISSIDQFINNVCIIESRFIGVCCPEFPIEVVSVNWKDNQDTFDGLDDKVETPKECGIGTNTRIVGGSDANVKAWPWMVALLNNKNKFFCGGSLINNRYVLTAAHCTYGVKNNEISVRVGEFDFSKDQGVHQDYRVAEIKRHGHYNRYTLRNDIALLKLQNPVIFNEIANTICFPDETKNYTGKVATLTGWGHVRGSVSAFSSDVLQEVDFPIVTNEDCSKTHGLPIPQSLICTAAPSNDKGACNGDSGGPLMMLDDENRWKVVGIVSWGRRGCNTKYPSVFTRVTHYLDWIKQHAT